jgi:DNA-binding PadR family transcriptional regulator
MHGYGIMQFVKEISNERLQLGPGTLYGAINTMIEKNWIKPVISSSDSRKKEYIITDIGKNVVKNELSRLTELVEHGNLIIGSEYDEV